MPFFEQQSLFAQWDFVNDQTNTDSGRAATKLKILICPSDNFQQNPFNVPADSQSGVTYGGNYAGGSYAGNYGEVNYHPTTGPIGPSKASGVLFLTGPSGSPPNLQPISLREITDGLSNTILLGEKFHRDVVFDQITPASRSNLLMYQWSMWAWSGGFKGAGHVFGSAAVPINSRVASRPAAASGRKTNASMPGAAPIPTVRILRSATARFISW